MKSVIISIKPEFCKAIYSKQKTFELRKKIGIHFDVGTRLFIYTSTPQKELTGEAVISSIQRMQVGKIKEEFLKKACITHSAFDTYFSHHNHGYVIGLESVISYKTGIPLSSLQLIGFKAPQSFMYADQKLFDYIEKEKCI